MKTDLSFFYNEIPIERLDYRDFRLYLQSNGNAQKALFEQKIVNTKQEIFGLYSDQKEALFKYLKKTDFSKILSYPATDFETVCLQGRLIVNAPDPLEKKKRAMLRWLQRADSWAHTDSVMKGVRIKKSDLPFWYTFAKELVSRNEEFFVRFGVILLMSYFLTDETIDDVFALLSTVGTGAYYVDMAIAWLLATALIDYKKQTLTFLFGAKNLNAFTVKMTFRKARESFRISDEDKKEYAEYQKNIR